MRPAPQSIVFMVSTEVHNVDGSDLVDGRRTAKPKFGPKCVDRLAKSSTATNVQTTVSTKPSDDAETACASTSARLAAATRAWAGMTTQGHIES